MATNMDAQHETGLEALEAFSAAAAAAAAYTVYGGGDDLIVLRSKCPVLPGEQDDDGVRAIAAIDLLRHLVANYETEEDA